MHQPQPALPVVLCPKRLYSASHTLFQESVRIILCLRGLGLTRQDNRYRLGSSSSAHHHQPSTNRNQDDADIRRQKFVMMRVDAEVNIAGIDAMVLGVRDRDEERQNTEHDNNESNN